MSSVVLVICRTRYQTDGQSSDYMLPSLWSITIGGGTIYYNQQALYTQFCSTCNKREMRIPH